MAAATSITGQTQQSRGSEQSKGWQWRCEASTTSRSCRIPSCLTCPSVLVYRLRLRDEEWTAVSEQSSHLLTGAVRHWLTRTITACSHSEKGSLDTVGSSWLHHLQACAQTDLVRMKMKSSGWAAGGCPRLSRHPKIHRYYHEDIHDSSKLCLGFRSSIAQMHTAHERACFSDARRGARDGHAQWNDGEHLHHFAHLSLQLLPDRPGTPASSKRVCFHALLLAIPSDESHPKFSRLTCSYLAPTRGAILSDQAAQLLVLLS